MAADDLLAILDLLERAGLTVWIDGGWGVDALLGEQTREHDDVDLVVELVDVTSLIAALTSNDYELVAGSSPTSFVLVDAVGRQVDFHPVVFDEEGGGIYRMEDVATGSTPQPALRAVDASADARCAVSRPKCRCSCTTGTSSPTRTIASFDCCTSDSACSYREEFAPARSRPEIPNDTRGRRTPPPGS